MMTKTICVPLCIFGRLVNLLYPHEKNSFPCKINMESFQDAFFTVCESYSCSNLTVTLYPSTEMS